MKHLVYFIFAAELFAYVTSQDLHTVSINSRNDVEVLRPYVATCLWGNGDGSHSRIFLFPIPGCFKSSEKDS
jgi:hypothetical protein